MIKDEGRMKEGKEANRFLALCREVSHDTKGTSKGDRPLFFLYRPLTGFSPPGKHQQPQ